MSFKWCIRDSNISYILALNFASITVVCSIVIFSGCAPQLIYREISSDSPQAAFEQLVKINDNLVEYKADGDIQVAIPSGYYKLQAKVHYQKEDRWLINLIGPFGLNLANIETDGKRYIVDIKLTGASLSGYLDEPFYLKSLDMKLPRLDIFVNLMLPIIDIDYSSYEPRYNRSSINDSLLVIKYHDDNEEGLVTLNLSFDPLIVYSEERSMSGVYLFRRDFVYESEISYIPESIKISHNMMSIDISYSNIRFHDVVPMDIGNEDQS